MPESLVVCPSCGQEVPNGKYCNLCGEVLPSASFEKVAEEKGLLVSEVNESIDAQDVDQLIEPAILPHFDVVIKDMPHDSTAILLSESEMKVLDEELDRIIEQTKATRQALQLRQADKNVLTARAETLRDEFENAKQRRRELASVQEKLPLESILSALDKHEERLSKLEAASGNLDKDVYNEQRIEILKTIKELRESLKDANKTGQKWAKGIKITLKQLEKETSRLDAKYRIGDISREKYESSRQRLKRTIRIVEGGQKRLDELLNLTKRR